MAGIEELRAGLRGQTVQKPETRSWLIMIIVTMVVAFAGGVLLVLGWNVLQPSKFFPPSRPKPQAVATVSIAASSDRIGRAKTAPMLGRCIRARDPDLYSDAPADLLYGALKSGSTQSRVRSAFGKPSKDQARNVTEWWAALADCVYQQDGNALCDPDNRALAVEAATSFIRHAKQPPSYPQDDPPEIDLAAVKERVLASLRSRLRNGVLIAADFGFFAPQEISSVTSEIRPTRNACPQQR